MIVYGICTSCKNHITIASVVYSREELTKNIGSSIRMSCKRCGVSNFFDVDQIKAKLPKRLRIALLEVAIVGLLLAMLTYTYATSQTQVLIVLFLYLITAISYLFYTRRNLTLVKAFNRY